MGTKTHGTKKSWPDSERNTRKLKCLKTKRARSRNSFIQKKYLKKKLFKKKILLLINCPLLISIHIPVLSSYVLYLLITTYLFLSFFILFINIPKILKK